MLTSSLNGRSLHLLIHGSDRHAFRSELSSLRSQKGGAPVMIIFINRTNHEACINWIDFEGRRQYYKTVRPGETHRQPTYVNHNWEVTSQSMTQYILPTTQREHQIVIATPDTEQPVSPFLSCSYILTVIRFSPL
jgi:hypothetical protein